jgi:hypothetical protein
MTSLPLRFLSLAALALGLGACPVPADEQCRANVDCPAGEVCRGNLCIPFLDGPADAGPQPQVDASVPGDAGDVDAGDLDAGGGPLDAGEDGGDDAGDDAGDGDDAGADAGDDAGTGT